MDVRYEVEKYDDVSEYPDLAVVPTTAARVGCPHCGYTYDPGTYRRCPHCGC